jgi:hypothetical protein
MSKKHGLGLGAGTLVEHDDGTVGYVPSLAMTQAFRVRIADVTGVSVTKGRRVLERTFNVMGNGTLLGSAGVPHGAAEKIEAWFRAHPDFGQSQRSGGVTPLIGSPLIADELRKLADLKMAGVLTEGEFAAQKAKLLRR